MNEETKKKLEKDPDGLLTYEYIANHMGQCDDEMPELVDNMISVDATGQFLVSASRYLAAIDKEAYADSIGRMVAVAIERDRERRYIGDLLSSLWGEDFAAHADELMNTDDNFRRIYKRVHPTSAI